MSPANIESNTNRRALAEVPVNTTLLPSKIISSNIQTDPTKIFQRKRQQSLTTSFINSPTSSLKRRRNDNIDIDSIKKSNNLKKAKIWRDLDNIDKDKIEMVVEYNDAIFEYLYDRESKLIPNYNYTLEKSSIYHVRSTLRAVLVDWLTQVHEKFQCVGETLLLAINIMDRFLSENKVQLSKLQLVAITSLFIAAKFYEINLPKLANYAYVTDGAATCEEIISAEFQILQRLNFEIASPNPMDFLRRISKADNYNETTRDLAKFFVEYSICSPNFIGLKPSVISAISMYVATQVVSFNEEKTEEKTKENSTVIWNEAFIHYSGSIDINSDNAVKKYSEQLIQEVACPSTKLECLIQKFKRKHIYSKAFNWCKTYTKTNKL